MYYGKDCVDKLWKYEDNFGQTSFRIQIFFRAKPSLFAAEFGHEFVGTHFVIQCKVSLTGNYF